MKTLTKHDIELMLIYLKGADDCFNEVSETSWADLGKKRIDEARTRLLRVALSDVAVEPMVPVEAPVLEDVA